MLFETTADRRFKRWKSIASKFRLKFSNCKTTHPFDFLSNVDLIISGDSNIHLEAASMNVSSIYFDSTKLNLDWYGFKKNGIVDFFDKVDPTVLKIKELIIEKKNIRNRAKLYIETINTKFDGKSTELCSKIINDFGVKDLFKSTLDKNNNLINRLN